ncbi:MAG: hypothetical protein HOV94_35895 [Saccharothrix sp.]|nr:hypothetical protein [Saccharothrix sp.]
MVAAAGLERPDEGLDRRWSDESTGRVERPRHFRRSYTSLTRAAFHPEQPYGLGGSVRISRIARRAVRISLTVTTLLMLGLVSPSMATATTDLDSGPNLSVSTIAATTVQAPTDSYQAACKIGGNCPPSGPPKPPPTNPPVAVTCESYDPTYIIFEDSNGNGYREATEPIHVQWGFHIEWCYVADSNYPSAPVFTYTAYDRDPIITPGTRWEQSGAPTRRDERSWSADNFLETVTVTWGTKTFSTVVLTPVGELRLNFNPVIQLRVDGFGNQRACNLAEQECTSLFMG